MKQVIKLKPENYSKTLREDVSSNDLRGYVEVNVKNVKTGEIEHQENHNLIVYGGREWLLRKIFGKMIVTVNDDYNDFIQNSGITWVGFGCGGGEPGNPLQCGTTMGSDKDLYQPVRVRFEDDSNTLPQSKNYASRVLPNGTVIPGYFKKISNITIKEDHANPYVQDGVTKYPSLIAELRIELSADDCNGVNYTENGNLVAYQDINEVALFIADQTVDDPGAVDSGKYDTIYTNFTESGEKVYRATQVYGDGWDGSGTDYSDEMKHADGVCTCCVPIERNSYKIQYRRTNTTDSWADIDDQGMLLNLGANQFKMKLDDNGKVFYSINGGLTWNDNINGHWSFTLVGNQISNYEIKIIPLGSFDLTAHKSPVFPEGTEVNYEMQYRNFYNEPWKTLYVGTFDNTGTSTEVHVYNRAYNTSTDPKVCMIDNGSITTMFRCKQTSKETQEIPVVSMLTEETSYDVKCYFDLTPGQDIPVHIGDFVYTKSDQTAFGNNAIPQSAPLKIIDIVVPEHAAEGKAYFVIERMGTEDIDEMTSNNKMTYYTPSTKQPYQMFSRVTLSSIRKSVDREVCIIYKLYV